LSVKQLTNVVYEFMHVESLCERHPVMHVRSLHSHPSKQVTYALQSPSTAAICEPQLLSVHDEHAELPGPVEPAAPLHVGGLCAPPLPELLLQPTTTANTVDVTATKIVRAFMVFSSNRPVDHDATRRRNDDEPRAPGEHREAAVSAAQSPAPPSALAAVGQQTSSGPERTLGFDVQNEMRTHGGPPSSSEAYGTHVPPAAAQASRSVISLSHCELQLPCWQHGWPYEGQKQPVSSAPGASLSTVAW
jgi:hypothetical protein